MESTSFSKLWYEGIYINLLGNNISDLYEPSVDEWVV
jgi:hypothetical protein